MTFKVKVAVFSNTAEDHKKLYGEKYDPSKPYPAYSGKLQIPESQLASFIKYLQECKPDASEFHGEPVVPIKVSGWLSESSGGKKYLGLNLEPEFKKQKEIEEGTNLAEVSTMKETTPDAKGEDFPF